MAFTDAFNGTANSSLAFYSSNWTFGADGNSINNSSGSVSSAAIASTTGFVTVSSGASNTWWGCPDQGVDANGRQYMKFTFNNTTAQNAFRLYQMGNSITVDGFALSLSASSNIRLINLSGDTVLWNDTTPIQTNDVLAWGVNKSASTVIVQINGVNRTTVTATTGSAGTRQGFYTIAGAGTRRDSYGTNFEAGTGPIPSGTGSIVVKAINFYSQMRNS